MPDVFKREMQKGMYDGKYNTGGRAKGKKKKMREIKGKEFQLIRGNWLLVQYQISKRREKYEQENRMKNRKNAQRILRECNKKQ